MVRRKAGQATAIGLGLLIPLLDQEAEEGNSGFIVLFLYEPSVCRITITQIIITRV